MTNYWPGLISTLMTLWVVVSRQLGLVLPRVEESGDAQLSPRQRPAWFQPDSISVRELGGGVPAAQASTVVQVPEAT